MRDLATDLLDLLALLLVAGGLGLLSYAAVVWSRSAAALAAGLVVAGVVVLTGSLVANARAREPEGGSQR